jgi:glycogen(starch) synthase
MRILLCSHVFAPSIGGIETVSEILAGQFQKLGAAVTVVTNTPGEKTSSPYPVVRCPSAKTLRELAGNADVVYQNNISLKTLLPLFFSRKPIVITHQVGLTRPSGKRGWQDYLKRALLARAHNVSISTAIAADLPVKSVVIPNPFDPGEFNDAGVYAQTKDIVFLGRLVSDKGCDLAVRALGILKQEGLTPSFTVIGDGPEMLPLKQLAGDLGVAEQIEFLGSMREGRGQVIAQHKIMVVPSVWNEPFGVVALEGIAAGCAVVASSGGGLPEAVGPCGLLFPNGDLAALTSALKSLLTDAALLNRLTASRTQHLQKFLPETVARRYLEIFKAAIEK